MRICVVGLSVTTDRCWGGGGSVSLCEWPARDLLVIVINLIYIQIHVTNRYHRQIAVSDEHKTY